MSSRAFLAKLGLVAGIVGSVSSLAIGVGTDLDAANRTGLYSDVSVPGSEKMVGVVGGVESFVSTANQRFGVSDQAGFTPGTTFHGSKNGSVGFRGDTYADSATNAASFLAYKARGTFSAPTAVLSGDLLGVVGVRAYGATSFSSASRASMQFFAQQNWSDTNQGTYTSFFTTSNNSTTTAERLRIEEGNSSPGLVRVIDGTPTVSTSFNNIALSARTNFGGSNNAHVAGYFSSESSANNGYRVGVHGRAYRVGTITATQRLTGVVGHASPQTNAAVGRVVGVYGIADLSTTGPTFAYPDPCSIGVAGASVGARSVTNIGIYGIASDSTAGNYAGWFDGAVNITSTTESTSTVTGSLITAGGVGVAKSLYVGGELVPLGNQVITSNVVIGLGAYTLDGTEANSVVVGHDAGTTADYTVVIGDAAFANQTESVVLGDNTYANAAQSTLIGSGAYSQGTRSIGIGAYCYVDAADDICIGGYAQTNGTRNLVIGSYGLTGDGGSGYGDDTIAIGYGAASSSDSLLQIGGNRADLAVSGKTGNFQSGDVIAGSVSGATAVVVTNAFNDILEVAMTSSTNFAAGDSVTGSLSGHTASVTGVTTYTSNITSVRFNRGVETISFVNPVWFLDDTDATTLSDGSVRLFGGISVAKQVQTGSIHAWGTGQFDGTVYITSDTGVGSGVQMQITNAGRTVLLQNDNSNQGWRFNPTGTIEYGIGSKFGVMVPGDNLNISRYNGSAWSTLATLDSTSFNILYTTDSTSETTGALQVAGGVGIAKSLFVLWEITSNDGDFRGVGNARLLAGSDTATASLVGGADVSIESQIVAYGASAGVNPGGVDIYYSDGVSPQLYFRVDTLGIGVFTGAVVGAPVALTDAATIAVDLALANNFTVTLGGNRTLGLPTNITPGQSGRIMITQDGTGSRTLAYNTFWKFPGGTIPTLSTAAGAIDVLVYEVLSSGTAMCQVILDIQ